MVRPHLEYATQVKHLSYEDRLKHLELPTLEYLRGRAGVVQVNKNLYGIDKIDKENLFQSATYTSTRGQSVKLFKP